VFALAARLGSGPVLIALGQINPLTGNVEGNVARMRDNFAQAMVGLDGGVDSAGDACELV
jgi:hypothetical protein